MKSIVSIQPIVAIAFLIFSIGESTIAFGQGFTMQCEPTAVTIEYDGSLVSRYNYQDQDARKPYLWPIIGPTGKSMTRAFPMEKVEGEQHDHPHHRGVWFGHQGISGTDTWLEAASKNLPNEKQQEFLASLGKIVHTSFSEISATKHHAVIRCSNDYLTSTGKPLVADQRSMIFSKSQNALVLDFNITLVAKYGDVELQDMKDAGLNVRVPTSMSLTHGKGSIINSAGDRDVAAWSKKAQWCDYHGNVAGEQLGVAFFNHPTSFRHPTRWHVRDYGLFTANAFGMKSLEPTDESGTITLKKDDRLHLRHRILFHTGDEKSAGIAKAFQDYAAMTFE